jgi:translation elongation factor EF-4
MFTYLYNHLVGKKRMKAMGKVNVPQEAFMAVIQIND